MTASAGLDPFRRANHFNLRTIRLQQFLQNTDAIRLIIDQDRSNHNNAF